MCVCVCVGVCVGGGGGGGGGWAGHGLLGLGEIKVERALLQCSHLSGYSYNREGRARYLLCQLGI